MPSFLMQRPMTESEINCTLNSYDNGLNVDLSKATHDLADFDAKSMDLLDIESIISADLSFVDNYQNVDPWCKNSVGYQDVYSNTLHSTMYPVVSSQNGITSENDVNFLPNHVSSLCGD